MKGQTSYIIPIFTLLLTGILAGAVAVLVPGQFAKITQEIDDNEFENKAILFANSLLGNKSFIYSDGISYQHDALDATKLDSLFFESGSFTELYRCKPSESNCAINTYPDSYTLIIITDMKTSEGWFTGTNRLTNSENGQNIEKCFMSKTEMGKDGQGKIFNKNSDLETILELDKCDLKRYSHIMNLGFPISIRYPDGDVNIGLLKVMVVE